MLAVTPPLARVAEREPLHRAGHRDITKPAFFLDIAPVSRRRLVREDALLEPGHEHHRKLEALGGVHSHQGNAVVAELRGVEIGDECDLVEEALERRARFVHHFGAVGSEILRARHQFAQVLEARFRLGCVLALEREQIAAAPQRLGDRVGGRQAHEIATHRVEHFEERDELAARAARGVAGGEQAHAFFEGNAARARQLLRMFERGVANAARRAIRDARERGGVRGVHHRAQITKHVLHFGAVVEAHAAHHDVGHVVLEQLLFDRPRLRVGAVEDRALAVLAAAVAHFFENAPHHVLRLVALVARFVEHDALAFAALGDQLHRRAAVLLDYRARPAQDLLRRAVVARQLHRLRARIVALEVEDVIDVGAAPSVNRVVDDDVVG